MMAGGFTDYRPLEDDDRKVFEEAKKMILE